MNRLQKKCAIAAIGLHLLLAVMMVVGSAFLSSSGKVDNSPILDFVPSEAIDGAASGGGNPGQRAPQPPAQIAQPPAQPQAVTPVQPKPEPVKVVQPEPPKIIKPSSEATVEPVKDKHKIVVNTETITRNQKELNDAKVKAQQAADAQRQRLAAAVGRATREIKGGLSGSTEVKFSDGFGGGGASYANWLQIVKSIYYNDWVGRVPDGATDNTAAAVVAVTIARDGTVITSHITQSSGNAAVDKSIQSTLERVRFTTAFPKGANEDQRELEITFSVKAAKQLLG